MWEHRGIGAAGWSERLEAAGSHADACQVVVEALMTLGALKPSVYLERGGRLRCQAVATYAHVFDGMPATAGVIGRTFSTGAGRLVPDVAADPDYLEVAGGLAAAQYEPVLAGTQVVGVLAAESAAPLRQEVSEEIGEAAVALGRRLEALGGRLPSTAVEDLLGHAADLAAARDRPVLQRTLLRAAARVAGLDSAVLYDAEDGVDVLAAAGPLGPALAAPAAAPELARAARLVASGSSCVARPHEGEPAVLGGLVGDGVRSFAVLRKRADRLRVLLVAGREPHAVPTEAVEQLELLCVLAASVGRSADLLADLERQAATDPLTGLGHHGTFHARLAAAAPGAPRAVVMLDLDRFKAVNDGEGHAAGDRLLRAAAAALREHLGPGDEAFRIGGDEFALLLGAGSRDDAVALADRVRAAVGSGGTTTASAGVALASGGEPLADAAQRADAALYAAKAAGRDRVVVAPD